MALNAWWMIFLTAGLAAQGVDPAAVPPQSPQTHPALSSPEAPRISVAFGGYSDAVSDGYGHWQGLVLDVGWDPWKNGKWVGSLLTSDRPEGYGTVASLGKYQEFRGGYAFLGLTAGTGADYLPRTQWTADLNVDLPLPGLVLGGGAVYTQVLDGHENLLLSLGPTWYAGDYVTTLRVFRNRSNPGQQDSSSTSVQIRRGAQDFKPWQSLRVAWGGEAYQNLLVRQAVSARGMSAGFDCFFPVGKGWTVQAGVEWAQKDGAYHLWGGSLRVGRMLP
ncbi:MAG TPA: YaiO family outer membrane beta-barrel protein [Holophagaceae bacterium]